MPLPENWIDALFARMQVRYAQAFERNYAGMDLDLVKADWANELDGTSPKAIAYALVNLPVDWPPNVMQFRALCVRGAPERIDPQQALLPPPRRDPRRLAGELERLHAMLQDRGPKQWAYDLQDREAQGEALSEAQRLAWRNALASDSVALQGTSYEFQDEELPPGMRRRPVDPEDVALLDRHVRQKLGYPQAAS